MCRAISAASSPDAGGRWAAASLPQPTTTAPVLDAVATTATALLLIVFSVPFESLLGLPASFSRVLGIGLLPWAAIVAYLGTRRQVSRAELEAWRDQSGGPFRIRMLPGDHFFLNATPVSALQAVAEDLGA